MVINQRFGTQRRDEEAASVENTDRNLAQRQLASVGQAEAA